jgi:hypothetical protein
MGHKAFTDILIQCREKGLGLYRGSFPRGTDVYHRLAFKFVIKVSQPKATWPSIQVLNYEF